MDEPDVAVVGTKGQVVIPLEMRKQLNIGPKSKVAIYRKGDKLVVMKLHVPSLGDELKSLFRDIDREHKGRRKPSQLDIMHEVQVYRLNKRVE